MNQASVGHVRTAVWCVLVATSLPGGTGAIAGPGSSDQWLTLDLSDPSKWRWVGPAWQELEGTMTPNLPHVEDNLGFFGDLACSDLEAEFNFKLNDVFGSAGFLLRARDATHYYLVHFPFIGQQARAKHFWACISRMAGNGWLEILRMEMVGGVASEPGITHRARVVARGERIEVWVDGRRGPTLDNATIRSGRFGLETWALFAYGAMFSEVRVRAALEPAEAWDDSVQGPQNWFVPYPHGDHGQASTGLVRAPDGALLMAISTVGLVRSTDNGRTWQGLEAAGWKGGFLVGPWQGKMLTFVGGQDTDHRAVSADNGMTWSAYEPVTRGPFAAAAARGMVLQPCHGVMLLDDGSLLSFHPAFNPQWQFGEIHEWGALHNTGWSARSTDGGLTWSAPVPMDGPPGAGLTCDVCEFSSNMQCRDGTIISFLRPIYSPWMWEVRSSDGGTSWGPSMRGSFPGYACTSTPRPTRSNALVVGGRMPDLSVHVSHDDGLNWRHYRVGTDTWAMGAMFEVEPDLVLYVYQPSANDYMRAQFLRVTADGLAPAPDAMPAR